MDALALSGRLDDARLTFEKMLTYGNHRGLCAEEIGPPGHPLGNLPQAFSHLSLISAAINVDKQVAGTVSTVLEGREEAPLRHRRGTPWHGREQNSKQKHDEPFPGGPTTAGCVGLGRRSLSASLP